MTTKSFGARPILLVGLPAAAALAAVINILLYLIVTEVLDRPMEFTMGPDMMDVPFDISAIIIMGSIVPGNPRRPRPDGAGALRPPAGDGLLRHRGSRLNCLLGRDRHDGQCRCGLHPVGAVGHAHHRGGEHCCRARTLSARAIQRCPALRVNLTADRLGATSKPPPLRRLRRGSGSASALIRVPRRLTASPGHSRPLPA